MKKLFSRVISIFAVFALISCGLISCSDIENNESGSVSFSISPDLAKAVLDTGRSLRAETDPTVVPSANESPSPYRIEVSLSGGRAETKRHSYTESEWQAIAEKSESVKGKENVTSFTFDNIPVGTQIAISATIFYARDEQLVYPCMAGKSATVEIQQGDNPVSFNVHRLAMFNLYNNTESGETISDISKLDVYALPKGSEVANKILALVAKDDSKNDPEIYEILSAYSKIYSYSKPDSPYLTGGYELKNGAEVYMLSLLYTSDGVYLGHPDVSSSSETLSDDALTVIKIDEVNNIHLKLMKMDLDYTYIFPAKYEDKEVSAWYVGENYDGQADYHGTPCIKTEASAVFLFSDKTFVITSHSKKISNETEDILSERIEYVMRGNYELSGDNFANGTFTLTPTAKYVEGRGWVALSEATQEQQKLVCEVTNGKFTPSSMEEPYEFVLRSSDDYLRVYRGSIDDTESGKTLDDIDESDFTNLAFFPSDYADKTVSAWYASEEVSTDKTKIYALYLFGDNTFVATKREIQDSGETREIDQQGQYTFGGNADFENGGGTALVESKEYSFSIVDGVFSIEGVDTTYELQNGALPEPSSVTTPSIQVIIKFLFENESGQYAERDDFKSITAGSDWQATIPSYTAKAYLLGYIMSTKTDSMPSYDSKTNAYVLNIYYDLNSPDYSATGRGTPEDSSIQLAEEHQFTFTAYHDSTYDIKYSGGDDTDKIVSKGAWEASESDETITIIETAYYDFASSSDTLTAVQGSEEQTFSLAESSFNFKSANGIEIAFYFDGQEPESVTLDGGITVKLDSLSSEDLGEKISLSVEKAEDGKSVKITASPDESITVSQYKLILFKEQEQLSPEGTLDSSTGSYVWTLTENIINNLSAGNHQITVIVTIAEKSYTVSANLTITK